MGRRFCRSTPHVVEQRGLHMHWPNVGVKLPSMLWIVVMLLRQRDDQLKIGWTKVRT